MVSHGETTPRQFHIWAVCGVRFNEAGITQMKAYRLAHPLEPLLLIQLRTFGPGESRFSRWSGLRSETLLLEDAYDTWSLDGTPQVKWGER